MAALMFQQASVVVELLLLLLLLLRRMVLLLAVEMLLPLPMLSFDPQTDRRSIRQPNWVAVVLLILHASHHRSLVWVASRADL
uniref:Putative secreted protein n=1 Tax=Anopheles darlingi TaxID=43151 RepID=A0A2M4D8Q4_ANODA